MAYYESGDHGDFLAENICRTCGKSFICHNNRMWVYKRRVSYDSVTKKVDTAYFCSYTCMRTYDSEHIDANADLSNNYSEEDI